MRRAGFIPAVIYGAGKPTESVAVEVKDVRAALRAGAAKGIVNLKAGGDGGDTLAIVKETQYDALGDDLLHVDFLRITAGKPLRVMVPLVTTGRAQGEAEGGVAEHLSREVNVECLPDDIPEQLEVDITSLALGQTLHLSDVPVPKGVTFLDATDTAIVVVKAPRAALALAREEEEAAAAAAAAAAAEAETAEGEGPAEAPPTEERPSER